MVENVLSSIFSIQSSGHKIQLSWFPSVSYSTCLEAALASCCWAHGLQPVGTLSRVCFPETGIHFFYGDAALVGCANFCYRGITSMLKKFGLEQLLDPSKSDVYARSFGRGGI